MAAKVVYRRHSLPVYNDNIPHQTLSTEEGIYETPTWRTVPTSFMKELMFAPRKKKVNVPTRRSSAPASLNNYWSDVRKRLDFDGIEDTNTRATGVKTPKRRLNRDPTFAKLHCEDLAVPFVELQVSPRLSKKVKFSDDVRKINSYVNTPLSTKSNGLSLSSVNSEDLPPTPDQDSVVPPTPKSLEIDADGCDETPIADPWYFVADEKSSLKSTAEHAKTPDWDGELVTPVVDPSYRLMGKPEPKTITNFTNLTDTPREEAESKNCLKNTAKALFNNAAMGIKRSSARSLSFK